MARDNNYIEILKILGELRVLYPNCTLGQHISTALSDYGDFWGISNHEFLSSIRKYKMEMEYNLGIPEKSIDKIIEEGTNLDTILNTEEEEYE